MRLDEGTARRSALDIAEELETLGATLASNSTLDTTAVAMSALKENLRGSLDILADVIRNPAFSQTEIDKLRARWLARIEQEKANPVQLALRMLPPEIYGAGHAYGVPWGAVHRLGHCSIHKFATTHGPSAVPPNLAAPG